MPSLLNKFFVYIFLWMAPFLATENVTTNDEDPASSEEYLYDIAAVLNCTRSEKQYIYSPQYAAPIVTTNEPMVSGRTISFNSVKPNGEVSKTSLTNKEINLILDIDSEIPGFIVFNKRGKAYCSHNTGMLNFPDHFSYRCLTKDRKIITAGYQKSNPIVDHDPVRRLVNDNINKMEIDLVQADNIVIEFYESSSWLGTSYTINVKVPPMLLEYYTDDIIAMLGEGYATLENLKPLAAPVPEKEDIAASHEEDTPSVTPPIEGESDSIHVNQKIEHMDVAENDESRSSDDEDTIEVDPGIYGDETYDDDIEG